LIALSCVKVSSSIPTFDSSHKTLIYDESQIKAVKSYVLNGFANLRADFESNGSQIPIHIGLLARLPLIASYNGLCGLYFDNNQVVMNIIDRSKNLINKDKHNLFLANGDAMGTLCFTEYQNGDSMKSTEYV
jgi:hypothetical protein